jgi:ABC-type Mn2+/Zn2+ transport system permease subunit
VTALRDLLVDPFRPPFMQRALLEVLLLSIPAGLLGAWVVIRRLAFLTHALGHATFPALVIAVVAGWSLFGAALVASVLLALGLSWLSERPELADGVAVAVVLSAALALGSVLVSDVVAAGVRTNALLFGSLLTVDNADLARGAVVAVLALAATAALGRRWAFVSFDRDVARAAGLRVRTLDAILMLLLAASVAVAVSVVGSLMVSALFLIPSATARLVARRVPALLVAGVVLAAADGVGGLWIAFRLDAPPGACIGVVSAGVFAVVAGAQALVALARRERLLGAFPS